MSLWGFFQSFQIVENKHKANSVDIKANRSIKDIDHLEERIDALALVTHAMWELIEERTDITKRDLENKVEEIDLRDGKLDGKLSSDITHCPDCGHKLNKRRKNCFWCGAKVSAGIL